MATLSSDIFLSLSSSFFSLSFVSWQMLSLEAAFHTLEKRYHIIAPHFKLQKAVNQPFPFQTSTLHLRDLFFIIEASSASGYLTVGVSLFHRISIRKEGFIVSHVFLSPSNSFFHISFCFLSGTIIHSDGAVMIQAEIKFSFQTPFLRRQKQNVQIRSHFIWISSFGFAILNIH